MTKVGKIKLFCFPYAGGSSAIFNTWHRHLGSDIQLRAIELAGRGKRINEPFYSDLEAVVEDVFDLIRQEIDQSPYALFGHSMGALIGYELAQKIRRENCPAPLHLFFSGRRALHVNRHKKKKYHLMAEEEFKREVIELGGMPDGFFDSPELVALFLPVLKNDFKIVESIPDQDAVLPLDGNITVFLGKQDDLSAEECDGWKTHSHQLCSIHYFQGGHFFLNDHTEQLVRIITSTLYSAAFVDRVNLQPIV